MSRFLFAICLIVNLFNIKYAIDMKKTLYLQRI